MEFKVFGYKLRLEVVLACMLLGFLISVMTVCSCARGGIKEGMALLKDIDNDKLMDILSLTGPAKPEHCPSQYTTSGGCYNLNNEVGLFINSRGNNRPVGGEF
tara:strand:+ start:40 stop:348 length:309 start_codon:yes stop_codon:yes gene_type:complete